MFYRVKGKTLLSIAFCLVLIGLPNVLAHVSYVLEDEEIAANKGADYTFLGEVLQDNFNVLLMLVTVAIVLIVATVIRHNKQFLKEVRHIKKEGKTYEKFIPWMARLSLGIALIGAGSSGVLISPTLEFGALNTVQMLLGFLLFTGLFIGPTTIVTILLFLFALAKDFYMLGNFDFVGLALAILIFADGRPGVDDLLGIRFLFSMQHLKKYVYVILRWCIGLAMIFLGLYEKILNPHWSELVVVQYGLQKVVPVSAGMWVLSAGIIETIIGLLLVIGWRVRVVSAIAFVVLSLSFFYFSEAVFSHITLFATLSILFITGGGIQKKR